MNGSLLWKKLMFELGNEAQLPKLIIGLCGRARHGKDCTAETMRQHFEAQGRKCYLSTVSGAVIRDAYRKGLIPHHERARCTTEELDFLVQHGHAGRAEDESKWIRQITEEILLQKPDVAFVPGVRFPNEIDWVRAVNGVVVRIVRYNADGSMYITRDRDPNDPMETILNRIVADYELSAKNGQEGWLAAQGRALATHLGGLYA